VSAANDRWFSFLGLANRAGTVVSGEEQVIQAVRQNKANIVILSEDASARTKKTITNKCASYKVPLRSVSDRQMLGKAIGKVERVVVAVNDKGFSDKLITLFDLSLRR